MKFLLIMQVCSALHMSCMDPMEVGIYKPHFEMKYGYQTSQLKTILLSQIDQGISLEGRYPRFFET